MTETKPPITKLCFHWLCNWHRILCLVGLHKLLPIPFALDIHKNNAGMFLVERSCCICTKRVEVRERKMISMELGIPLPGTNEAMDDNEGDGFTVH